MQAYNRIVRCLEIRIAFVKKGDEREQWKK
jgi:hypothetical protein